MDVKTLITGWLLQLISEHRCQFPRILECRDENRFIVDWIKRQTLELDKLDHCKIAQRIYWIVYGISSWDDPRVRCRTCGKPLIGRKSFGTFNTGYAEYCSTKCSNSNKDVRQKGLTTRLAKNGGKYFSDESMTQKRDTCMKKYGAPHNMQSEKGLAEYKAALMETYGVENQFQRKDIIEQIENMKLEKYGDAKYNNSEQQARTRRMHAEADPHYETNRCDAARRTWIRKYGVSHPMKNPKICTRAHKKWKHKGHYMFGGDRFVSIPELAFALWCNVKGIQYVYEDDASSMEYLDANANRHTYFPDFHIVGYRNLKTDFLVEIKGDNHFKDRDPLTGVMISFKGPDFDHVEQAKYKLMTERGVIIVTTARYKKYIDWAKKTYGKDFQLKYRCE